jgi:hypothetical protein
MLDHDSHRESLREKVAAAHGFELYKRYSEKDAAPHIGCDYSTLKRKRRTGLLPFVDLGGGSVGYMGYHIADIIVFGVKARVEYDSNGTHPCPDTRGANTESANGGSDSARDQPPTMASATTPPSSATTALALARRSLR